MNRIKEKLLDLLADLAERISYNSGNIEITSLNLYRFNIKNSAKVILTCFVLFVSTLILLSMSFCVFLVILMEMILEKLVSPLVDYTKSRVQGE